MYFFFHYKLVNTSILKDTFMKTLLSINNPGFEDIIICRSGKEILSTALDRETVVLDMKSGVYSGLDAVGTFIWDNLVSPIYFKELLDRIVTSYDVEEKIALTDLLCFLSDLADNEMIVLK